MGHGPVLPLALLPLAQASTASPLSYWPMSHPHPAVRATLHQITGISFQGCYWEDATEIPLFRSGANDVNHYNIDSLQYESSG